MKNNKNKKGFTLIEVVVALAVFTIVIISASGAFASIFKSYKEAKDLGDNVKNAQYALGLIGKTLRTSTIITSSDSYVEATQITVFDYSRPINDACIRYLFSGATLSEAKAPAATTVALCGSASASFGTAVPMTTGDVEGRFYSIRTLGKDGGGTNTDGQIGLATISLHIKNKPLDPPSKYVKIQTSVSLRDYTQSNIGIDITKM